MNLTINEQLMIDTKDANLCIFIANLATWIRFNASKRDPAERNYHDGRYWSYNTIQDFVKYFGFWSTKNIRTIIKHCCDLGLVTTSTFNKKKYDNTIWYALTDKGLEYYPQARGTELYSVAGNGKTLAGNGNAIPEHINSLGNNIISDIVETYHEELTELPKIKTVDTKLKGQLQRMVKNWPSYQKEGKEFTIQSFRDYLNYIKQHYSWLIKPYTTDSGNVKRNSLRVLTREINISKIVNGEFSAN